MNDTPLDLDHLRTWIGRGEAKRDTITAHLVSAYRATVLDIGGTIGAADAAPQGIHWCIAQASAPMSELGPDGHPARGGFLPPVPLPRRMWAGGRLEFFDALRVGDEVERRSMVRDVALKQGGSGPLCFVTVEHVFATSRGDAVREEQDLVYREAAQAGVAATGRRPDADPPKPDLTRTVQASPILLFRYSALTFNGHRIHYDRPYATVVEGYDGLVVHGPLQASLLLDFARAASDGREPRRFRGVRPLIDAEPIVLSCRRSGEALELWTGARGRPPSLTATAFF